MSIRLQLRVNDSRFARVAGKGNEIAPGHDASAARGVRRAAADRYHHLEHAGPDRRVRAAEARRGLPVEDDDRRRRVDAAVLFSYEKTEEQARPTLQPLRNHAQF